MARMHNDTLKAKNYLNDNNYTCVLMKDDIVCYSEKRGMEPLLELYDDENSYEGYSAADRVIGKAAAMVYVELGVKEVYVRLISKAALALLRNNGISVFYDEIASIILCRDKTDFCPMEKTVMNIDSIEEGIIAIKNKFIEMNNK